MSYRKIKNAEDAKRVIEEMTDHTYDARSVELWMVEKISELEHKIVELERKPARYS